MENNSNAKYSSEKFRTLVAFFEELPILHLRRNVLYVSCTNNLLFGKMKMYRSILFYVKANEQGNNLKIATQTAVLFYIIGFFSSSILIWLATI